MSKSFSSAAIWEKKTACSSRSPSSSASSVPIARVDGVQHFVGLFERYGLMVSKVCSRSHGQPPGRAGGP